MLASIMEHTFSKIKMSKYQRRVRSLKWKFQFCKDILMFEDVHLLTQHAINKSRVCVADSKKLAKARLTNINELITYFDNSKVCLLSCLRVFYFCSKVEFYYFNFWSNFFFQVFIF